MLFDSDVLIWALRGHQRAVQRLEKADRRRLSVVSYMELIQGVRDKREWRLLKRFLSDSAFELVPFSENIGHRAVVYMEEHGLNAGMRLGDALIAATAAEIHAPLCSGDARHYRAVAELEIDVFRP
ncbi:MAG: type II toxin-antitoxin system VapC family toxin [Candidatus Aminicenantes bacterium]|nr:type II toxin-antitoxin system VapC family toxin [Candidatus Aminicenantes bacterium]